MKRKKFRNIAKGENTVIGSGTVVEGAIVSDSMIMRVDGTVNGGVSTKGELVVGANGVINGNVEALSLELAGKIYGNAMVKTRIEIEAKGELIGDIDTEILSMDETAILQGRVNMVHDKSKATEEPKVEKEAVAGETKESEEVEETKVEDDKVEESKDEDKAKDNE